MAQDRPVDGHLLRHRYGAGRMARANARRVLQRNGVATGGHRHPFGSFRRWLLVRNNGGRLRQLGVSILAWVLIPILLRLLVNILLQCDILHAHAFKAMNMANSLLQLALGITVFWAMRRSFVPNWE